jgi:hypothetical protein
MRDRNVGSGPVRPEEISLLLALLTVLGLAAMSTTRQAPPSGQSGPSGPDSLGNPAGAAPG